MLGMADAYHLLGKDDLARQWYKKAFAINPGVGTEPILKYIEILSTSRNSAELRHWVTRYNSWVTKSSEPFDSTIFIIENLTSLNSKSSDSAPFLYDSKIIFSSDRSAVGNFNSYQSTLNSEGIFGDVSSLHGSVNSGRNEGGFAIATNAATLFFTSTEKGSITTPPAMEIFTSAIPTGPSEQLKVNRLTFKNFDHSIGHPAVNSNGTMLYFAAHSPKHTRGFDLYHSQYSGKKWSAPVALGTSVNSHGDELYPMLVNDSILYFTSNGHGGLGGFDIFKINLHHTHHHQPEHLPAPVNSPADEFGFTLNSTGNESYLSSNRPGGLGGNDLYRIYTLPLKKKKHDAAPKQEELFIYTAKGDEIKLSGTSKENLKFDFQPGQMYNLVVEYDDFRTGTTQSIKNTTAFTKLNVYTFDIQKSSETVYDQKSKSKQVQDIHINPGNLVTFQLIPNMVQDPEADVSKIEFQKSEAIIADGQSIVFSYVAEGGPGIPEADMPPVADLSKLDTVSTQPQVVPTTSVSTLATTTPASQKITTPDANLVAEKTTAPPAVLPTSIALPEQPTNAKFKEAGTLAIVGNAVETQQQNLLGSVHEQSVNKVSTPTGANDVVVAAKTDEKNPMPSMSANDTTLNKPSVITKKNADTNATEASLTNKVASNEVVTTQTLPVQNNVTQVTPLVVAEKTGEKNLAPSKNANDTTLNEPSVTTKKNVDAKATEASLMDKVASTEVTPTQALPVQNNVTKTTPLVPANMNSISNTTDIQYRVQIAASTSKLSDDQLKKIYTGPKEIGSFSEEGYHKYYIEQTPSFPDAKRTLKESGVGQAFISAYQGEKKLNLQEAITLQKKTGYQTSSPIRKPEVTRLTTEQLSAVNTQPNSSTEVLAEKTTPITTEKQVAVTQSSQETPSKVPVSDATTQNITGENKLPVSTGVTNEGLPEKTVPVSKEGNKEKQAMAVTQSSQNAPSKVTAIDSMAQNINAKNKLPVSNEVTNEPVSFVNTQPGNSKNLTPVTTETNKEKQVAVVIPSTHKTTTNVSALEETTQENATVKKTSHDITGRNDFLYRVQIAASEVRLSDTYLKKIYHGNNEIHTFEEERKYKYYILETPNYFVADQTLKKTNIDHAFISAYKRDVKVPLEEAINAQYEVPVIKESLAEIDSVIKVTTVNFALDEFELQRDQLELLHNTVISDLRSNPSYRVIVNGYTDIRGSETYNFGLSQERALFVDQQIVAEGIDTTRVTMRYFGESQLVKYCPQHENCDESIHQANRRVEILLLVNKKSK